MVPEVLGIEVNLYIEREHGYRSRPLRDILAEAGIFPGDETEAMFWLIGDDEKRVRTAERFYRVEYPELYEETIRFIREIPLKHLKAAEMSEEPDFTERYIL
jgi:hypothetical protein